ncbi:MAG: RNA methyltransferase [Burkholderiaceae bacterium]
MTGLEPDRIVEIESTANDGFRQLLALTQSSRERRKRRRSVIEGSKLFEAYLDSRPGRDAGARAVYIPAHVLHEPLIVSLLARHQGKIMVLTDALFKLASQMAVSNGPIAIIDTPQQGLPSVLESDFVYLDRVQDPGNMGTILRTCAAAGVVDVVTSKGTAFCWAPKVLRAAMGAHFGLRIVESIEPPELMSRIGPGLALRALLAPSAGPAVHNLYSADLRQPAGWLFGSEGAGLRPELRASATERLSIDQAAGVESLNVAAAVAISLFEARRQRQVRPAAAER